MIIDNKLTEYKNNIESLHSIDSLEVYRWLILLGKKVNENPLSEKNRIEKNRVKRCQFDLFVDWEDGKFKAWTNAMVAGGYAYVLLDILTHYLLMKQKILRLITLKKLKWMNYLQ